MATINCPECGKEVSDNVLTCPNCGFPLESVKKMKSTENTKKRKADIFSVSSMLFAIFTLILVMITHEKIYCILTFFVTDICYIMFVIKKKEKNKCANVTVFIAFFLATIYTIVGDGTSNISQEEYDAIVAEKEQWQVNYDNLKNKYIELTAQNNNGEATTQSEASETQEIPETVETITEQIAYLEMYAGTFVVGEDIESGKYDFEVISGNGELKIYNSYEEFKNDEYGFDSFLSFDILAEGASRGLLNEDVCTSKIRNIELSDGQVVIIEDGATLHCYNSADCTYDENSLNVGIYVVGIDIEAGKYDFKATDGMGEFKVYNTKDEFLEDDYGYDAFADYDMRADGADVGLTNEDIYTEYVQNLKLEDGNVVIISEGLTVDKTVK